MENVSQRDPRQKGLQSLQALSDQGLFDGLRVVDSLGDDKFAELENRLKFRCQSFLELLGLISQDCVFTEVENFFTEKFENIENIFALGLRLVCSLTDVRNEVVPADSPFLLYDGDQS